MPHRADHPTPSRNMLMRGRGLHGLAMGHHPPPPLAHPPYQMHPADVAAVAAHRARYFAAGLPPPPSSYGASPMRHHHHHMMNDPNAAAAAAAITTSPAAALAAVQAAQREQQLQQQLHEQQQQQRSPPPTQAPPKKRMAPKEESPEEAAASALLLAANGGTKHDVAASNQSQQQEQSMQPPVKKRKKHLDFLRRNSEDPHADASTTTAVASNSSGNNSKAAVPCHVSPVSSSSVGTHSTAEETVSTNYATPASRSSSYDLRDGQVLNHEDRMKENMDIEEVVVVKKHFPSILHNLLSNSDFAGTVLQWLPHGQAWKVLRWDALRREVLPKHFAKLGEEKGGGGASIDSFLSRLKDWGFDEITDGPDVGAYCHELFVRDTPKLCQQMRSSTQSRGEERSPKAASSSNTNKPSSYESPQESLGGSGMQQPHSILQVPSLRSDVSSDKMGGAPQKRWAERGENEQRGQGQEERAHQQQEVSPSSSSLKRNPSYPPLGDATGSPWNGGGWGRQGSHYRNEYARQYQAIAAESSSMMMGAHHRHGLSPGRPWFPFGSHEQHLQHKPHGSSPPRVRSTRGGARAAVLASIKRDSAVPMSTESREAKKASSFPVSQRGKGPRGGGGLHRSPIPRSASHDNSRDGHVTLAPRLHENVAVAISRKTTMRKVTSRDEGESQEAATKQP